MKRATRYVLSGDTAVSIVVESDQCRPIQFKNYRKEYEARLLDLSRNGARLVSELLIPTGNTVRLKFCVDDLGFHFYVAGAVCWCEPWEEHSFVLGCALTPGLPDSLFVRFAENGKLDRRFQPRTDEVELLASLELSSERLPVKLLNYSMGGYCILSPQPSGVGVRLPLCIEEPHNFEILSTAQWQLDITEGYLIGAAFLNPRDFERIDKASSSVTACQ